MADQFAIKVERQAIIDGLTEVAACFDEGDSDWSNIEAALQFIAEQDRVIGVMRAEMERRDRNENRNCLNWGPCSRHDGSMTDKASTPDADRGEG